MKKTKNLVLSFIPLLLIKVYQLFLSPLFPPSCRYYPSCSNYSKVTFKTLPLHKALFKTILRISKCHPWSRGGYDPLTK